VKLSISNLFEDSCLTIDDGNKLYELIHGPLSAGESVELVFAGVRFFATPFFNASIGRLLADFSVEELRERLVILHAAQHGEDVIRTVVEFAKRYYSDEPFRRAIDSRNSREATPS